MVHERVRLVASTSPAHAQQHHALTPYVALCGSLCASRHSPRNLPLRPVSMSQTTHLPPRLESIVDDDQVTSGAPSANGFAAASATSRSTRVVNSLGISAISSAHEPQPDATYVHHHTLDEPHAQESRDATWSSSHRCDARVCGCRYTSEDVQIAVDAGVSVWAPRCLCLVSRFPWVAHLQHVLLQLYAHATSGLSSNNRYGTVMCPVVWFSRQHACDRV